MPVRTGGLGRDGDRALNWNLGPDQLTGSPELPRVSVFVPCPQTSYGQARQSVVESLPVTTRFDSQLPVRIALDSTADGKTERRERPEGATENGTLEDRVGWRERAGGYGGPLRRAGNDTRCGGPHTGGGGV